MFVQCIAILEAIQNTNYKTISVIKNNKMFQENPIGVEEFYNLLFDNEEFNSELGRVSLATGRPESS